MSAVNHVVAETTISTLDQIKNGALKTVNWIGYQVSWLASSFSNGVSKVVEWIKPFLASIGKFVSENAAKARDFFVTNKDLSMGLGIGAAAGAILAMGIYFGLIQESPVPSQVKA